MNIPSLRPAVKASDQPLESLAGNTHISEAEKVAEASRQFEAVLLRQILSQARKTVVKSQFNSSSTTSDIYQDMVTSQIADKISQSGAFGLAQSLQVQMSRQVLTPADAASKTAPVPVKETDVPSK